VLDASALLCLLQGEAAAETIIAALPRSVVSAVNLSEVYAKLADVGGSEQQISRAIGGLHLRVEPFGDELAMIAGMLRPATKALGLSLGDRACLALAQRRQATALTTDRAWNDVPEHLGISIRVLR
jgi:ribonuclease VapC